ncbi:MAG: hypothetical protein QM500_03455 [Methylococcales bacterium]
MLVSLSAQLKVFYLLILATGLFFINQLEVIALVAGFQLALWLYSKLPLSAAIKAVSRLKWFVLLIILSYLLIPPGTAQADFSIDLKLFELNIYFSGLDHALLMLSRVLLLVISSLWVRLSEPKGVFVGVLQKFGVPDIIAIVIDAGLSITSGDRSGHSGSGHGKGKGQGGGKSGDSGSGSGKKNKDGRFKKTVVFFDDIRQGRFDFIDNLIASAFEKSRNYMAQNYPQMNESLRRDASIILMVVIAVMSLKLIQLMPGLPFAPGHKNTLVLPLLVLASMMTSGRFGGFAAGFSIGVVSFLLGYGKFGIFEVFQFALPGLVADLLLSILVTGTGAILMLRLAILGAILGLTRFVANFMVLMLAGSPELAWVVFLPMLISQVVFGTLSCLVCVYIVKLFREKKLPVENT